MKIVMVGTGYVGLVSGTCLAEIGHQVVCVDIDQNKINRLKDGISPIYEPGIEDLIKKNQSDERLSFSCDLAKSLEGADAAFIAVGTPPGEDGQADLKYVEAVAKNIGLCVNNDLLVIVKSTVPVGSCDRVEKILNETLEKRNISPSVFVASNPEFLKEGTAISDFMEADRIVVGLNKNQGTETVNEIYHPFLLDEPKKLVLVERRASEMIKYTANAMLATRISFMNELSKLCEKLGVNIDQVRKGVGSDPRIGSKFLNAGPGFGGSCFPKDVSALLQFAAKSDVDLKVLNSVMEANHDQKTFAAKKIENYFQNLHGKKIAVWGLSFKPGTDDVRESPSKTIISHLLECGAKVVAHDPQARETFTEEFGKKTGFSTVDTAYEALESADALVLMTEWKEYLFPSWEKITKLMSHKAVFDFRNQYEFETLEKHGFHYECIGRIDSLTIKNV